MNFNHFVIDSKTIDQMISTGSVGLRELIDV